MMPMVTPRDGEQLPYPRRGARAVSIILAWRVTHLPARWRWGLPRATEVERPRTAWSVLAAGRRAAVDAARVVPVEDHELEHGLGGEGGMLGMEGLCKPVIFSIQPTWLPLPPPVLEGSSEQ